MEQKSVDHIRRVSFRNQFIKRQDKDRQSILKRMRYLTRSGLSKRFAVDDGTYENFFDDVYGPLPT